MTEQELKTAIEEADTIPALDKLRMDVVSVKSRELLKMWQEKFWERKKKYSYSEVQAIKKAHADMVIGNADGINPNSGDFYQGFTLAQSEARERNK